MSLLWPSALLFWPLDALTLLFHFECSALSYDLSCSLLWLQLLSLMTSVALSYDLSLSSFDQVITTMIDSEYVYLVHWKYPHASLDTSNKALTCDRTARLWSIHKFIIAFCCWQSILRSVASHSDADTDADARQPHGAGWPKAAQFAIISRRHGSLYCW